jgi:hypothetical protein
MECSIATCHGNIRYKVGLGSVGVRVSHLFLRRVVLKVEKAHKYHWTMTLRAEACAFKLSFI